MHGCHVLQCAATCCSVLCALLKHVVIRVIAKIKQRGALQHTATHNIHDASMHVMAYPHQSHPMDDTFMDVYIYMYMSIHMYTTILYMYTYNIYKYI